MNVLITGNHGYIGPILENVLTAAGHKIIGLDTNYFEDCYFYPHRIEKKQIIKDIRELDESDLKGVDAVVHLAALSNDSMGQLDPKLTEDINFRSTVTLANLCKKVGVDRFIYSSSCSIYGVAGDLALTEESEQSPQTAYAHSKVNSEKSLMELADDKFCPVYMRNGTAYGVSPRMRFDLVLNNLTGWAHTTGKIKIMSDGTPWRPIVHIEDISLAMLAALEAPREKVFNQAFNVGRDEDNYQIKDMAEMVKRIVPGTNVEFTNEHGSDSRTYNVNFDKIKSVLPNYQPKWNLEKGTVELFEACKKYSLSLEDFQGPKYIRLKQLAKLKTNKRLDKNLSWS